MFFLDTSLHLYPF